jgi:pyruvate formate lyase activating enzyme
MFRAQQCQECGTCAGVCEHGANTLADGVPLLDREMCRACGKCVEACPSGARELSGRRMALEDVVDEACRDELFYTNSGGGVTLSGGEPLCQPEFSRLFLKACQDRSIHTALDTSGHAPWPVMERVLEYADLVLFDLKHISAEKHLEGTQARNDLILENLKRTLEANGSEVWIRVPVIPGYNDAELHMKELALVVTGMGARRVSLLGYHEWGRAKYAALGRDYPQDGTGVLPEANLESMKRVLEAEGIEVTIGH